MTLLAGPASAAAPVVSVEPADPGYTTASLEGEVNPEGKETNCHFDYVSDSQFGTNEWASASQAPCAENPLNGNTLQAVSAELSNLAPHTTYHLRLVAENEDGSNTDVAPNFETEEVAKPTISNLAVSGVTTESAHFSAEIDPNGTDPAFDATWSFSCTPSCNATSGGTVSGAADEVQGDATDLDPHTEYTIHLIASNAGGQSEATKSFTTASGAPLVNSFAAGPVQSDQVLLNGEVDPRGSPTTYWFEWGSKDCAANPCQKLASQSAGEGPYYKWAEAHLTGLVPSTTYHFRLVAENALGTTEGSDQQFTTAAPESACPNQGQLGTGVLPDCRAWEMVSPPDKNGISLTPMNNKNHVSADGGAITFTALGSFGEVTSSAIETEYLARRTAEPGTNGWATHGIYPLARPATIPAATFGNSTTYLNAFSPDLNTAVFRTWHPLTTGSNVESVTNLYRVSGFADGAPDSTELLSDASTPVGSKPFPSGPNFFLLFVRPNLVGASTDISHVFFEEALPLTSDALALLPPVDPNTDFSSPCVEYGLGCPNQVYESTGGQVHLVGRVPASGETFCDDAGSPVCEAAPQSQAAITAFNYGERVVSADGRRIYFEANGQIFLREDGKRTYEVAKSGNVYDASRDGSRAFFVSSESLVAGDQDGGRPDVFMWDREAPAGNRLTLLSVGAHGEQQCAAIGVLGTSDNGHYTYFACDGPTLIPGQPKVSGASMYLWHDGELAFVGKIPPSSIGLNGVNSNRVSWLTEGDLRKVRVSPDGRHLLVFGDDVGFEGLGGYGGSGKAGHEQHYLYNADTGRIACASCNPSGEAPKQRPLITVIREAAASTSTPDGPHILSDDGHYVFFSSIDPLVSEDTNGTWDAYEYNSVTEKISLISSGTSTSPSYFMDATDDGSEAFFVTRKPLSGWDKDALNDMYVARVNGGLPEPPPVTASCEGESCLPSAGLSPAPAATSSKAAGAGNPPLKCPKGKRAVRRHGSIRCVKKHRRHHHGRKHRRAAGTDRRAGK